MDALRSWHDRVSAAAGDDVDMADNSDYQASQQPKVQPQFSSNPIGSCTGARSNLVGGIVETPTTAINLRKLDAALHGDSPILLQGRSGAGKSLLINELARRHGCHDSLVELQLDEQMDSKTLLGTYVCTEIPGEFQWQPGALTQAVLRGCWVFIEDIDRAPFEVLAALIPLFETRCLLLPHRDQVIRAARGFQLFATTRTSEVHSVILSASLWTLVGVEPLSRQELGDVVKAKHPGLSNTIVSLMLDTFYPIAFPEYQASEKIAILKTERSSDNCDKSADNVDDDNHNMEQQKNDDESRLTGAPVRVSRAIPGRTIAERDFFKWLHRVDTLVFLHTAERNDGGAFLTEREREDVLVEAMDCFVAAMPGQDNRILVVRWMARLWRLSEATLVHRLQAYKPQVNAQANSGTVKIGRVSLLRNDFGFTSMPASADALTIATSGVSMRLLEQLAACAQLAEPVLLVGETGAGKTSMVQYLAKLLGKNLVVQNMHVQSDSTELLGGYRPVQLQHLARPLYNRFVELFCDLFSEICNEKFLVAVKNSMEKGKWNKLSKAFTRACVMAAVKLAKRPAADISAENLPNASTNKRRRTENGKEDIEDIPASAEAPGHGPDLHSDMENAWAQFRIQVERFDGQRKRVETSFAFSFEEGALVKAIRNGDWVLLDEINLASSETLERLNSLLDDKQGTLSLTERGDLEKVERSKGFRIFAAMNPSTDFGKKDLPPALRSRFTELYVDEVVDSVDLQLVVECYLGDIANTPINEIVKFYLECRHRSEEHRILDGANQPPRYSLRTLCRALSTTRLLLTRGFGLARALYESLCMTFATLLNEQSYKSVCKLIRKTFVPDMSSKTLEHPPKCPGGKVGKGRYVLCDKFWIDKGSRLLRDAAEVLPENRDDALQRLVALEEAEAARIIADFVVTPSVTINVQSLARAVAAHKYPVLLQGPTSSGKTTMVGYLAALTGHKCVRINNHEYTDLQEYMGSYVSDPVGKLVFREGVLVEAVRQGHWIVLDELNLAPSEVLEALNRLLDDNRELFIPETQEVVTPHPSFMLFATQNPPGLYGGRKMLSRAFRNRFLELHVGEIPSLELETILNKRCKLAPPFCKVLVQVMVELQQHRQQSRLFAGKDGYITPRDLLRWANRHPETYEELAKEGFRLLGDRVRVEADKAIVKSVIERHCKTQLTVEALYGLDEDPIATALTATMSGSAEERTAAKSAAKLAGVEHVVWTKAMNRVYTLVKRCLETKEPVLLVGETGCGKTTVCQILAMHNKQELQILNCHQNTDTADILGSLRPVRGKAQILQSLQQLAADTAGIEWDQLPKSTQDLEQLVQQHCSDDSILTKTRNLGRQYRALFEWQDGPLVSGMRAGDMFLLDELSLAEDAVLERLNSVLEPSRTLFLAEKGGDQVEEIKAHEIFRIIATMNPGGDYGKRELSPALRNRFTEIWIPAITDSADLELIVARHLRDKQTKLVMEQHGQQQQRDDHMPLREMLALLPAMLVKFFQWFNNGEAQGDHPLVLLTLRDMISWASFIIVVAPKGNITPWQAYVHGCGLVLLDGLGLGSGISFQSSLQLRVKSFAFLLSQIPLEARTPLREDLLISQLLTDEDAGYDVRGCRSAKVHVRTRQEHQPSMFGISPFFIPTGEHFIVKRQNGEMNVDDDATTQEEYIESKYALNAGTTSLNLARVLRAMQLARPILLEGSPGVGKTSLISSLAKQSGHKLVRINLSEQTDFSDLIGSDIPAGSQPFDEAAANDQGDAAPQKSNAKFVWSDGVFLSALKNGDWVLLDELNLASQSVLEGLNACLDHRSMMFVPELNQSFHCPASFRVFAAQNPLHQGGGRKGLPKSFLNRFTKVFVDSLTAEDYAYIIAQIYPTMPVALVDKVVEFNARLVRDVITQPRYGRVGAPWEFNLRDIFRLCDLFEKSGDDSICTNSFEPTHLRKYAAMVYVDRMRTETDRVHVREAFSECFGEPWAEPRVELRLTPSWLAVGAVVLERLSSEVDNSCSSSIGGDDPVPFLPRHCLPTLEHVARCVEQQWPVLLIGSSGTGKTSLLRFLARACGRSLHEFAVTSSTDSTELLGCFEQSDADRTCRIFRSRLATLVSNTAKLLAQHSAGNAVKPIYMVKAFKALTQAHRRLANASDERLHMGSTNKEEQSASNATATAAEKRAEIVLAFTHNEERALKAVDGALSLVSEQHWLACELKELMVLADDIKSELKSGSSSNIGSFEWVDGTLVRAMERGDWVVLDNANLCNPTVLDRLNPVLETDGELLINECGMLDGKPRIIVPHKNFRVFLVADPQYGEVSRAMRNRCVEIALLNPGLEEMLASGDAARVLDYNFRDIFCEAEALAKRAMLAHIAKEVAVTSQRKRAIQGPRDLVKWAQTFESHLVMSGSEAWQEALLSSFEALFGNKMTMTLKVETADHDVAAQTTNGQAFAHMPQGLTPPLCKLLSMTRDGVLEAKVSRIAHDLGFLWASDSFDSMRGRITNAFVLRSTTKLDRHVRMLVANILLSSSTNDCDVFNIVDAHPLYSWVASMAASSGLSTSSLPASRDLVDQALLVRGGDREKNHQSAAGLLVALLFDNAIADSRERAEKDKVGELLADGAVNDCYTLMQATLLYNMGELSTQDVRVPCVPLFAPVLDALARFASVVLADVVKLGQLQTRRDSHVTHDGDLARVSFQLAEPLARLSETRFSMQQLLRSVVFNLGSPEGQLKAGGEIDQALSSCSVILSGCAKAVADAVACWTTKSECDDAVGFCFSASNEAAAEVAHVLSLVDDDLGSKSSRSVDVLGNISGVLSSADDRRRHFFLPNVHANLLQRSGQPKPMMSEDMFGLAERIFSLSTILRLAAGVPLAQAVRQAHPSMLVSPGHRRMLSDAICTLEWANNQLEIKTNDEDNEQDGEVRFTRSTGFSQIASVHCVVNELRQTLDDKTAIIREKPGLCALVDSWSLNTVEQLRTVAEHQSSSSLTTIDNAGGVIAQTQSLAAQSDLSAAWVWLVLAQLRPMMDHAACQMQSRIITRALTKPWEQNCINDALSKVAYFVEGSSFAPTDLAAFQNLLWRAQAEPAATDGESHATKIIESESFTTALTSFYAAPWKGLFNDRDAVDADACGHLDAALQKAIDKSNIGQPSPAALGSVDFDGWSFPFSKGTLRVHQDLESVTIFRLLRGIGIGVDHDQPRDRVVYPYGAMTAVRDRAPKLAQLDLALSHLLFAHAQSTALPLALRYDADTSDWGREDSLLFTNLLAQTIETVLSAAGVSSLDRVQHSLVASTLMLATDETQSTGQRWVWLALFRLHALLPDGGIDPSLKLRIQLDLARAMLVKAETELELRGLADAASGMACGPAEHTSHPFLTERAAALRERIASLSKQVIYRPEQQDFARLHAETTGFCATLGSVDFVNKLVAVIMDGKDRTALSEEQIWQDSSAQLCTALEKNFSGYHDLVQPLLVAIYQLKHGLRVMAIEAFGVEHRTNETRIAGVRRLLGAFPATVCGVNDNDKSHLVGTQTQLEALESVFSVKGAMGRRAWTKTLRAVFERALACLRLAQNDDDESTGMSSGTAGVSLRNWTVLDNILSVFADQFSSEKEERRKQVEDQAETLKFKTQTHVVDGPAAEEDNFNEMFPDFHAEFDKVRQEVIDELEGGELEDEGGGQQHNGGDCEENDESGQQLIGLEESAYTRIIQGILGILEGAAGSASRTKRKSRDEFDPCDGFSFGYHAAGCFAEPMTPQAGAAPVLLGGHLFSLVQAINALQRRTRAGTAPAILPGAQFVKQERAEETENKLEDDEEDPTTLVDLSRDSFAEETVLLEAPLLALSKRLDALLAEWPENAVLLQLAKLTMRLRELPLSCPLMRALVGIETLLQLANDWETVAHRKVSIAEELQPLIRLVVRWRKLELQSWPLVLLHRQSAAESKAKLWFYDVYRIVGNNSEDELIGAIFASMDQFARTATLGTFRTRIKLMHSLRVLMGCRARGGQDIVKSNVLWNLARYYSQWTADVEATLDRLKAPIKKKLRDHTKLATWDDRNYFALRESAAKSHRVLHKLARDYDEVMDHVAYATIEHVTDSRVKKQSGAGANPILIELDDVITVKTLKRADLFVFPTTEPQINDAAAELVFVTPKGYGSRLQQLAKRMRKLSLNDIVPATRCHAWEMGLRAPVELNRIIVSRIQSLRTGKAPQGAKQRALVDLFNALNTQGVHRADAENPFLFASNNSDSKDAGPGSLSLRLFSLPAVDEANLSAAGLPRLTLLAWARFDNDYFKSIAQLQRFRHCLATGGWTAEIPSQVMQRSLCLVEHVFEMIVEQRRTVAATLEQSVQLATNLAALERLADFHYKLVPEVYQRLEHLAAALCSLRVAAKEFDALQTAVGNAPHPDELVQFLHRHGAKEMAHVAANRVSRLVTGAASANPSTVADVSASLKQLVADTDKELILVNRLVAEVGPVGGFLTATDALELESRMHVRLAELPSVIAAIRGKCGWVPIDVSGELSAVSVTAARLGKSIKDALLAGSSISDGQDATHIADVPRLVDDCVETVLVAVQAVRMRITDLSVDSPGKQKQHQHSDIVDNEDANDSDVVMNGDSIASHNQRLLALAKDLDVKAVNEKTASLVNTLPVFLSLTPTGTEQIARVASLTRGLTSLMETYHALYSGLCGKMVEFSSNLGHLEFLLLRVFRTLASSGYCKPPEEDDTGDGNSADEDDGPDGQGTGMGEGKGREDVSDQIEDEEQLLGLKKDKEEFGDEQTEQDEQEQEKEEDQGMEMENDFEGEMYDVDDKEQQEESDNDDKDEEELDREMGDLDRENEHVVDEKLWEDDDDKDEDKDKEDDTFEKDAPMAGDNDEDDELRAKEENDDDDNNKSKDPPPEDAEQDKSQKSEDKPQQEDKEEDIDERVDDGQDVEERNEDVPQREDEGKEDGQEEEEATDLPDDMQVEDDGEGENDHDDEGGESPMEVDTAEDDVGDDDHDDDDDNGKETEGGDCKDDDEDNENDDANAPEQANSLTAEEADKEDGDEDDNNNNQDDEDAPNVPDNTQEGEEEQQLEKAYGMDAPKPGQEDEEAEEESRDESKTNSNVREQQPKNADEKKDSSSGNAKGTTSNESNSQDEDRNDWVRDNQDAEQEDEEEGEGDEEDDGKKDSTQSSADRQQPNPWTNPGSAQDDWHRRLQIITQDEEVEEENQKQQDEDNKESQQQQQDEMDNAEEKSPQGRETEMDNTERKFDFSTQEDDAPMEQVLAPSLDNQEQQTLDDAVNNKQDEDDQAGKRAEDENAEQNPSKRPDSPNEMDDAAAEEESSEVPKRKKRKHEEKDSHKDTSVLEPGKSNDSVEMDFDKEVDEQTAKDALIESNADMIFQKSEQEADEQVDDEGYSDKLDDDKASDVAAVELEKEDYDKWNQLAGETMESSQRLSEQLRLLLEPTLATKLRGDYRTGKRINMRRVIPYIASQFRKDKIWLRRTKPSKREYQVVLALDDSQSMAACGELALTALATMTKAMTKLEVGKVGVVSFGETVQTVHPLDAPFTDSAGAKVVAQFRFDQEKTAIEEGIERIISDFELARRELTRSGSSASTKTEFRQLAFFISDGRFDSAARARVQQMIRDAVQQRMLIVLIIVEGPGQESILETKQVSFNKGKVKMSNYLDDYPFPLYIVLEDMQALPEVLADALRQWFELLSGSE